MKTQILIATTALLLANTQGGFSPAAETNGTTKVSARQNTEFAFFRVHRQGKNAVTANWGVSSASGVAGFLVQRTYQDPTDPYSFWEDLSTVACNPSRSFNYTDANVFPGQIYYRIVAQMTDGTTVMSEATGLRILSH